MLLKGNYRKIQENVHGHVFCFSTNLESGSLPYEHPGQNSVNSVLTNHFLFFQHPRLAQTSHWRASTTATRAQESPWTNCVTSVQTVLSGTTRAIAAVSTVWYTNADLLSSFHFVVNLFSRVCSESPLMKQQLTVCVCPPDSDAERKGLLKKETQHRYAWPAFLTPDIFHSCYFYVFAHLFLLFSGFRTNVGQVYWHLPHESPRLDAFCVCRPFFSAACMHTDFFNLFFIYIIIQIYWHSEISDILLKQQ